MGRKEDNIKKATEVMHVLPQIRNLCIAAHIDHGKTTLSDNLIAGKKFSPVTFIDWQASKMIFAGSIESTTGSNISSDTSCVSGIGIQSTFIVAF